MLNSRRFSLSISSLLLIAVSILLYRNMFDNPFIHDDFFWLDSGKKISDGDFSGMFTLIAGRYCPAFIHLLFGACFKMLGLNYTWYHVISLSVHVLNGTLLYILIYLLFHDNLWALLAVFFFAINPVVSNAILWPSAWVDLFATSGLLATLIFYKLFLDKGFKWLYVLAFFSFMVSIFSKVVGIGLPILLLYIEIVMIASFENKALKQVFKRVSPFFLASLLYLIPIVEGLFTGSSGRPSDFFYNAFRYIPALFLPERYLAPKTFIMLSLIPIILYLSAYKKRKKEVIFVMLFSVITLLPLTVLGFSLKPVMLIDSISHRLYLSSVGSQALIGLLVSNVYLFIVDKASKRFATCLIVLWCLFFLAWSYIEIDQKEREWDSDSKYILNLMQQIKPKNERFPPDTLIYLINVPSAEAFWKPMVRLYYNDPLIEVKLNPSSSEVNRYRNVYIWLNIGGCSPPHYYSRIYLV